ncbi:Membrane-anchored ribosome-binding protein, inhibits growth in stationary phase, ElaB/YqjD/DUF883 family [Albimonas donghaensis]|uniref:Membrane-anchored ribosome-binding protein, inhibits growth in stationary phase, ElaB/YqjD/DUF883 family n=1 Tax=Albimonas donghaensis TaxID=356660 RepID=A0A1H2WI27_9RHOB|nr:DUF883 family protein [Albimonas donghaensis]SDW80146.1 Membrane-anchored ribosome-binding protein, inhibits growth in stationary phase, ElaB/YqjD/DUF883 family [Albimonas donghaensis]
MATAVKTPEDKYDDLSQQIDALRADLAGITESVGAIAREEAQSAKARVNGAVNDAAARGRAAGEHARAQAEDGVAHAADYVRENPLTAVAGAAALGLVFGFLTARR